MAKTGHPNFAYICTGAWRGQAAHKFSIVGNHSGSSFDAADAETFMTGAASPFALSFGPFMATALSVVAVRYYDGQNGPPVYEADYNTSFPAPATLVGTAAAYQDTTAPEYLGLENVVLLQAEVGFNTRNKPIFLRKYLRGIPAANVTAGEGALPPLLQWGTGEPAKTLATLANGAWFGSRVYISGKGAQVPTGGAWTAATTPYNRQVPRGKRKKKACAPAATQQGLVSRFLEEIAAGGVANLLIP